MKQQEHTHLKAAQLRFVVSFPVLFLLSLAAHLIGGASLPTSAGLFAGAVFAALFSAILSRSALTIFKVSLAALTSQFAVHWAFQFVQVLGGTGHHHGHHPAGTTVAAHAAGHGMDHGAHSMFSAPMLLAHSGAAVVVAVLLVQLDEFLQFVRAEARKLFAPLQPAILIPHRIRQVTGSIWPVSGVHTYLEVLTKRGPPMPLSI